MHMKMWVGSSVIRKNNTQKVVTFKGFVKEKYFLSGVSRRSAKVLPYCYISITMLS